MNGTKHGIGPQRFGWFAPALFCGLFLSPIEQRKMVRDASRRCFFAVLTSTIVLFSGCLESFLDTLTLEGRVCLEDGTAVEGVQIRFFWPNLGSEGGGGPLLLVTDSNGRYSYTYAEMFDDERVIITPLHPEHEFSPREHDLVPGSSPLDLDFTAVPPGSGSSLYSDRP